MLTTIVRGECCPCGDPGDLESPGGTFNESDATRRKCKATLAHSYGFQLKYVKEAMHRRNHDVYKSAGSNAANNSSCNAKRHLANKRRQGGSKQISTLLGCYFMCDLTAITELVLAELMTDKVVYQHSIESISQELAILKLVPQPESNDDKLTTEVTSSPIIFLPSSKRSGLY